MHTFSRRRAAAASAALTGLLALSLTSSVAAARPLPTHGPSEAKGCKGSLMAAVSAFDEAFATRDYETYMDFFTDAAVQVDGQGNVYSGKPEIATFTSAVMRNSYTFEASVLSVNVVKCSSATVVEDSTFAIPTAGLELRLIDGVSWVRVRGEWKVALVQGTGVAR